MPDWRPASTHKGLFPRGVIRGAGPPPPPAGPAAPASPPTPGSIDRADGASPGEKPEPGAPREGKAAARGPRAARALAAASIVSTSSALGGIDKQRLGIAAGAGLGMLATFLPWATLPFIGTVTGTAGDGWITLALFAPALVLSLRGDRSAKVAGKSRLWAVIPAAIASLIAIHKIISLNSILAGVAQGNPLAEALAGSVRAGVGLYVLVLSGAAVGISAWALDRADDRTSESAAGGPRPGASREPDLLDGPRRLATWAAATAAMAREMYARTASRAKDPLGQRPSPSPEAVAGPLTEASPGLGPHPWRIPRWAVLAGGGGIPLLILARGLAGRLPGIGGGPSSGHLTKREFIARIDALGNPCRRSDLLRAAGEPLRTQTLCGELTGVFWYFRCRDGMVQVVLFNPKVNIGEHNDEALAYISKINDY